MKTKTSRISSDTLKLKVFYGITKDVPSSNDTKIFNFIYGTLNLLFRTLHNKILLTEVTYPEFAYQSIRVRFHFSEYALNKYDYCDMYFRLNSYFTDIQHFVYYNRSGTIEECYCDGIWTKHKTVKILKIPKLNIFS